MESVTLSTPTKALSFDANKCIICQEVRNNKPTSSSNGRKRIREASEIHKDNVSKRLKLVEGDTFCYHVSNDCYKLYTMKTMLGRSSKQSTDQCSSKEETDSRINRSQAVRHPPNADALSVRDVTCIICDQKSCKKIYTKYRICESKRASSFLVATNILQDDVFTRTCDLQDQNSVFGADLYYHRECMTRYLYRYETRDLTPKLSDKQIAWRQVVPELDQGMNNGKGYELSAIRDQLNSIDEQCNFRNRDVKVFLINEFGCEIDFTYPDSFRKSLMVYRVSNCKTNVLAEQIRSVSPVEVCANVIRTSLEDYNFGLDDSFCDAHDLKRACNDMNIPDPLLKFFVFLYNFNPGTYKKAAESVMTDDQVSDEREDNDEDDGEDINAGEADDNLSTQRCRKVQSLFQIMYYVYHCGRKRTPMHILNAESVHSLGRGGKIVTTTLNHEGLAISYAELRRYQHDLASFTAQHNKDRVALPSHFDPGQFTSGAIDNWDHEGTNVSEHDTVTVLYQDKPPSSTCKPNISDTQVTHGPQAFKDLLPCQVLSDFHKSAKRPDIPASYTVNDSVYKSEKAEVAKQKDTTWSLARLAVTDDEVSMYPPLQSMPCWSASNSVWTDENIPVKNLAFLPVLPYPVTEYATVYSAMKNFTSIGTQLLQGEIPMYCDEGVYCIVKEIQMMRPQEFRTLVPVMGTFHLTKTVLKCMGKALSGSGADITWLQAGVFGPTVIQNSVLNGGHYSRSLEGMQFLAEAFTRLLYKEFFAENGIQPYAPVLAILEKLKSSVSKTNISDSQRCMVEFATASHKLAGDLNNFIESQSAVNENFQFWVQFLRMMDVVHDLLRADREGIWELHLDAVQRALYLFTAFDSTNYLRWCSVYLEDMRRLSQTSPSVYKNFSHGNFSIKDKPGRFIAVGGDQKLEQSINLSSKCSDGVIGHAKQKQYVAQWDLIYHEMMAVKNLHREYAGVMEDTHESCNHHKSSQATTTRNESHIQAMIRFIEEKGSPLSAEASPELQNFVTKEVMPKDIRNDMLNAFSTGKEKYLTFRLSRFITKRARLSECIHRTNLKTMKAIRAKPQKTVKKAVKEMNIEEKTVEIARDRGISTKDLLECDVAPSPLLFSDDGMMTKPEKSQLLKELETHLKPEDYEYVHRHNSAFVIDTMATVRKVRVSGLSTFHDFVSVFSSITEVYHQFGRCDYVFDMYSDDPSVKDSERMRRSATVPIEHSSIAPGTPLPKEMDTFWPSNANKHLLEQLIYHHLRDHVPETRQFPTVVGQVTRADENWQCLMVHKGSNHVMNNLQSSFEEADHRIPLHVLDCLKAGHNICVVISNDTDVVVALLYHMPDLMQHNLRELWVRAGVGDSTRYVPLHTLYQRMGSRLCAVLPALHSLTGCDITSRVGTKKAALKAEPEKFLNNFGESPILSPAMIRTSEQYLVKVLKRQSDATNFTDLRAEVFHFSKSSSLHNLPPTSQGLLPHIQRAFYNAYTTMHTLECHINPDTAETLNAEECGYELDQGQLMPATSWKTLPVNWSIFCACAKCARSTCPCRMAGVRCGKFCCCKKMSQHVCKNPVT